MTKSTLKTLWVAGGGLLATWLAVTPTDTTRARSAVTTTVRPTTFGPSTADELIAQEAKLRDRDAGVPLRQSTRNPFRFRTTQARTPQRPESTAARGLTPPAPTPAAPPPLTLSGIAGRTTPQGIKRTAIISGDGQLYLVTEGEMVAGRFRVVTVEGDAVTLKDDSGTEIRLVLH